VTFLVTLQIHKRQQELYKTRINRGFVFASSFTLHMQVTDDMWYLFNLKHRRSASLMPLFQQELIDFIDEKVCQAIGLKNKEGVADTIACVNWVTANRSKLLWLESNSSDAMPEQKLRPLSCFITFESTKAKKEA
jgi:hypothetical protein